jgi:hypothetical protein
MEGSVQSNLSAMEDSCGILTLWSAIVLEVQNGTQLIVCDVPMDRFGMSLHCLVNVRGAQCGIVILVKWCSSVQVVQNGIKIFGNVYAHKILPIMDITALITLAIMEGSGMIVLEHVYVQIIRFGIRMHVFLQ